MPLSFLSSSCPSDGENRESYGQLFLCCMSSLGIVCSQWCDWACSSWVASHALFCTSTSFWCGSIFPWLCQLLPSRCYWRFHRPTHTFLCNTLGWALIALPHKHDAYTKTLSTSWQFSTLPLFPRREVQVLMAFPWWGLHSLLELSQSSLSLSAYLCLYYMYQLPTPYHVKYQARSKE